MSIQTVNPTTGEVLETFEPYSQQRINETLDQAHQAFLLWWYRTVPHHSYVKGWKISTSHYLNQDLATVWLDK